jgi:hypothetical protein
MIGRVVTLLCWLRAMLERTDSKLKNAPQQRLTSSGEVTRFSTASITPSVVFTAIAVEPSCGKGIHRA